MPDDVSASLSGLSTGLRLKPKPRTGRTAAGAVMAAAGSGATGAIRTTKLLPMAEAMEAMKLAGTITGSYRPPMG